MMYGLVYLNSETRWPGWLHGECKVETKSNYRLLSELIIMDKLDKYKKLSEHMDKKFEKN
jgi:hypothetical protein